MTGITQNKQKSLIFIMGPSKNKSKVRGWQKIHYIELKRKSIQLVSIMSKFFINITKILDLNEDQSSPPVTLEDILKKFIKI